MANKWQTNNEDMCNKCRELEMPGVPGVLHARLHFLAAVAAAAAAAAADDTAAV